MALIKPSWLESWLNNLNWDILGWHVYVGDAIESAIDFVLTWINNIAEWAASVVAWLDELRQEIVDGFNIFVEWLNELWDNFTNIVETWWDSLAEWWSARVQDIKDWIDIAVQWVNDRIDDVKAVLDGIVVWWENFTTVILPELASKFDITAAFDEFMLQWQDLFNTFEEFKQGIWAFFTDPLEWLWTQFIDWFLGREE